MLISQCGIYKSVSRLCYICVYTSVYNPWCINHIHVVISTLMYDLHLIHKYSFIYTECPDGFFGKDCDSMCTCRTDIECDKITGNCTCQSGYTGVSCHEICPNGLYGENCSTHCECYPEGTVRCDHINGTCSCSDMWSGILCDIRCKMSCWSMCNTIII